jgi:hypothetical protein
VGLAAVVDVPRLPTVSTCMSSFTPASAATSAVTTGRCGSNTTYFLIVIWISACTRSIRHRSLSEEFGTSAISIVARITASP